MLGTKVPATIYRDYYNADMANYCVYSSVLLRYSHFLILFTVKSKYSVT